MLGACADELDMEELLARFFSFVVSELEQSRRVRFSFGSSQSDPESREAQLRGSSLLYLPLWELRVLLFGCLQGQSGRKR